MTLAAVLLLVLLQGPPPVAADAVDPALSAAVARFFEMQEKEDVPGYMALWSPAGTPPRVEQLKYVFDSGDDTYSDLVISRVSIDGARARVRLDIRRQRTSIARVPGGTPFVAVTPMSIALTFEKVGSDWKLLAEGPAADDLAASLLDAKTDADREALLASEPKLAGLQVLTSLARLGGAAAVAQNYTEARRVYDQLIFAARRGGFKKEEGEALQNIANAFYFQRRYPEALAAYEQRLSLERDRQDDAGTAAALAGVATIRYSYAEYGEALKGYQEALALHEKTDDVAGIAFVSLSIGNIGYLQGDFPAAIAAYRRSLDINRTMSHADGESRALEGLGRVYTAQGDYAGALAAFDTVRADRRMATARGRLASVAQSIGEVHFRLGNLDAARASYEESRAHFEAVRDLPNVGRVLQGSAITELVASRFAAAEEFYKRSHTTCSGADDGDCAARATAGLAFAQSAQEKYWDAVISYRKAIEAFKGLGLREEAARSEIGLAQALVGAGDFAAGVEAATRGRHEAMSLENDDILWRSLTAEARAIRKLGDAERALGVVRAAVGVLDRMELAARDKPGASLPADATGALATFAVLQAERGDARAAFATSERLRAVDLRASLATNERDIARGMTAAEREEERRLATTVATFVARITREKGLPKPDTARIAALQESLAEAVKLRRAWMDALFERLPDLAAWRGLGDSATAFDLKELLPDDTSLLLSFVLDDEALLVFTVRQAPAQVPVPATATATATATGEAAAEQPSSAMEPLIEAFVTPVKRRQVPALAAAMQQAALADAAVWRKSAGELLALLPAAVTTRLAEATRVLVVPHDVLWRIPFDALPAGDGYLADRARVVVAGSAAMLTRAMKSTAQASLPIVAVGPPQLAAARMDRLRQLAPGWALRTEEEAASELRAATADAGETSTTLMGAAATERALREALERAAILHVTAPFRINAASPLFSAVLLSTPDVAEPAAPEASDAAAAAPRPTAGIDQTNDGALELREAMNLSASAQLALLTDGAAVSMRDSAAAADVIEWGWLAAGVPSLAIARWASPPPSRDRLLAEFYKQLRAGETVGAAWSAAQRLVRSAPESAAPVHWAGWMLLGAAR